MSKIWESVIRTLTESEHDEGLTFEKATTVLEDWVSFAKFHVLLQAVVDMNEYEASRGGISPEDKAIARKIAAACKKCLQVVEPLEKSMKSVSDDQPDPATKPTKGTPADLGSWGAEKK